METASGTASNETLGSAGKSQGGLPSSGDGSATTAAAVLRYAAQPDVVLSQERDLYYAETLLGESASELAETLFGSRRAVILGPELKALASCLYFGLTNFAGKQTLGQEYCDISLVREGGGSATLSRPSSQAYTLFRVAVPYLQERMREGWHGLRSLRDPFGTGGAAAALAAARARARARAALAPPIGIASPSGMEETRGVLALEHEAPTAVEAEGGNYSGGEAAVTSTPSRSRRRRRSPSMAAFVALLSRLLAWARRKRPATSAVLEWVLRLHLAAFYFDGRFANFAMRATGAKLAYTREQDGPRARYAVLGVLLLVQAAAEAASASAQVAARWRAAAEEASSQNPGSGDGRAAGGGSGSRSEGADSALPSRVPAVAPERTPADAALFPRSRRRCSLCMSPRESPAATPCGHLFCWECIVGWCQTNPECPLCRQPATAQSIVCLYQYA